MARGSIGAHLVGKGAGAARLESLVRETNGQSEDIEQRLDHAGHYLVGGTVVAVVPSTLIRLLCLGAIVLGLFVLAIACILGISTHLFSHLVESIGVSWHGVHEQQNDEAIHGLSWTLQNT